MNKFSKNHQNEDERDENDVIISNAKSNENETTGNRFSLQQNNDQKARPNDLPNLITNHTAATSPMNLNSNSNAVWNSDTWADGEFEPLDEPNTGKLIDKCLLAIPFRTNKHDEFLNFFDFRQVIQNWTKHDVNEKKRKFSDNVN